MEGGSAPPPTRRSRRGPSGASESVRSPLHSLQVEILDDSCDSQLEALWGNYTAPPVSPVAGCDRACLSACHDTLYDAIYSEQQQHCPLQTDIVRCFHVRAGGGGGGAPRVGEAAVAAAQHNGRSAACTRRARTACVVDGARTCTTATTPSVPLSMPQVYRAQWYSFVEECALFQWGVAVRAPAGACMSPAAAAAAAPAAAAAGEEWARVCWQCSAQRRDTPREDGRASQPAASISSPPATPTGWRC